MQRIARIRNKGGKLQHRPGDNAEVFAQVFEDRYPDAYAESVHSGAVQTARITIEEGRHALKALKNGRTGAEDGLVAEMLKTGHHGLVEALRDFSVR